MPSDTMTERPTGPDRSFKGTGFIRLWSGETASLAGAEISFMAMSLTAVITLSASPLQMGILEACESLAVLFLGLSVGVWTDRYDRRRLMLAANLGRCLALLVVPVGFWFGFLSMPVLYAVVFVVGALTLLFDSSMSAYLPTLVGKSLLTRANSWMEASRSVGTVAGPGVAGLLVQVISAPLALLVDAVSYLVSWFTLAGLPRKPPAQRPADEPEVSHFRDIGHGLRFLWSDRIQRPMVLAATHFNIFHAAFFAVYTLYVLRVLHFSPALFGVMSMAGGAAGLLGAVVTQRVTDRLGYGPTLILVYATPAVSALFVPLASSTGNTVGAAFLVATGIFSWTFAVIINLVVSETIKQSLVPDALLGRVTATIRFISWGIQPLGAVLGGALGGAIGLGRTMLIAAVGLLTSALWPLFSPVRDVRTLPADSDE
ncbi:MFS transporter [Dactylosporangium sp. NPDC005555]|uniref:MFS transporter n=1 Tax=Dactylosporangium sp. NPDC005555 TaxID=3154889 RepID=UPI0033BF0ED3